MPEKIVINPLTRISGFLEIEVSVDKNIIMDAKSSGMLFRGFEKMLENRNPLDAIFFTERICGICSTAHSYASAIALEDALKVKPSLNDKIIRDFIHGCEFIQNHLRHFYLYTFPDFVYGTGINPICDITDYRLPKEINDKLAKHYFEAIKYSRLAHKMLAILAGKAPHNHGIFVGGVTMNINSSIFVEISSILNSICEFVENIMIDDINIISKYYDDYFYNGKGYGNFLSYGVFNDYQDEELIYVKPGVFINNRLYPLNSNLITENITYSWYIGSENTYKPLLDETIPDVYKKDAYSFVKAPRYNGYAMEVGPLARMWISGEYRRGISTMDRMFARVLETKKICNIMIKMLNKIKLEKANQGVYEIFDEAIGVGLVDTTRGALGHYIKIKDKKIDKYTIITPTVWNLSPEDEKGIKGVIEKALIGTKLSENVVEIGRIVRSFDPCVSCATHVLSDLYNDIYIRVV